MELNRILIFRIGHLGDTLVALPALWAVREAFPNAHLTLLSNADVNNPHYVSAANILPHKDLIDSFISYPNTLSSVSGFADLARLAVKLRKGSHDAVIYLMTRNRTPRQIRRDTMFFRASGISRIIGADHIRENYLPVEIPKPTPKVQSEGEFLVELLRHEGIFAADKPAPVPELLLSDLEMRFAREWMDKNAGSSDGLRPKVAVAPGSKWESKIWAEDRFADAVGRLVIERNAFPVIFGGPEDREKGDRLIAYWGIGANAAGELNVRQAAAALGDCDVYVGNDTGTMHLAAAVGTPCVAIFAAIDWVGRWQPYGERNITFRRRVECEGCHSPTCFNAHKCLELISITEVYQACIKVLDEHSQKSQIAL